MAKWNMSKTDLITTLLIIFGRVVTPRELTNVVSPKNSNHSNLDIELIHKMQQGKIVRTGAGKQDDPYCYDLAIRPSVNYFFLFQTRPTIRKSLVVTCGLRTEIQATGGVWMTSNQAMLFFHAMTKKL